MKPPAAWEPSASLHTLDRRAEIMHRAREFFRSRNLLEVDTPILSRHGVTDPHINSIDVTLSNEHMWLRSSPEYHMKRLLAAGSRDIYQIGKAFRDHECGSRHQPEFTLIEWYRQGFTLPLMYAESCELIIELSHDALQPIQEICQHSYCELCLNLCGIDPLNSDTEEIKHVALKILRTELDDSLLTSLGNDRHAWLDLLVSHIVYPSLAPGELHVITDFPHDQAMLARLQPDNELLADRFEIFLNGLELANGFRELRDPNEQAKRFETDRERRRQMAKADMLPDPALLNALRSGLPDCCGVAVGLDRILMAIDHHERIETTMSFAPGC